MALATVIMDESIFSLVLENHISRFSTAPSFFIEDSEIIDLIIEEELARTATDAIEILERFHSFEIRIINDEWYCFYEPANELWLFNRLLAPMEFDRRQEAELSTLRQKLRKHLFDLSARQFELLLFDLFRTMPDYEDPVARSMTHDGGYEMDVRFRDPVTNTWDRILIQAKHENKPVPVSHTRELLGTLSIESSRRSRSKRLRGLMISLFPPSPSSEAAADESPFSIDFLSADDLVDLMIRNRVGCKSENIPKSVVDTTFWDEIMGE